MVDRGVTPPRRRFEAGGLPRGPGQMHGLLSEFRNLYENRLRRLDESGRTGEDSLKV